jgi:cell wall-associated NlpC family hydrolase
MALEGIAAVQARIQEIQQQVTNATAPASSTSSSQGATGADFASLLTDAMSTQTASGIGSTDTSTTGSSSSSLLSGLVSDLTGSGSSGSASGTTSSTDINSLLSGLTGGTTGTDTSSTSGASGTDISSLISSLTGSGGTGATAIGSVPNATTQQFVTTALQQNGKPYVWGSSASPTDPNPASFDCSELTKWAAARSGVTIPDGAAHQYVWLKEQGATMTVQQALHTPGALLFHFASEPQPGLGGEPPVAHVAISLGNGKTIEARGHDYGVGIFDADTSRFNYAGMIPGMN